VIGGCSSSRRFSNNVNTSSGKSEIINPIRILLDENEDKLSLFTDFGVLLFDENILLTNIHSADKINVTSKSDKIEIKINGKVFSSGLFYLRSDTQNGIISLSGKKYRGALKIFKGNSKIQLVNQVSLEDYVKGVMNEEMPAGKDEKRYEALKAFSICARTYAFNKMKMNKDYFDIYSDTRDQVYGGVDGESSFTNKIVDETKGQLLFFDDKPAVIFYHSTCGGSTENVNNVFGKNDLPYLYEVFDGSEPYCKISPAFEWIENYSNKIFVERLYNSKQIDSKNFFVRDIKIKSRFDSGRVNELEIILLDKNENENIVLLKGNSIRNIIKNSSGKSMLKSTMFDIKINKDNSITIEGKGYGHGVGLCQWGAIGLALDGKNYLEIIEHYFSGTKVVQNND